MGFGLGKLIGGGTKAQTTKQESTSKSFLYDELKDYFGPAIDQVMKGEDIPDQVLAGFTPEQTQAFKQMNESGMFKQLQDQYQKYGTGMMDAGMGQVGAGGSTLGQAAGQYGDIASGGKDISAGSLQDYASQLYNKDLVQSQTDMASGLIQRNLQEGALPSIYRQATGEGNVGSSRSAIAQGVAQRGAMEEASRAGQSFANAEAARAAGQAGQILQGNQAAQLQGASGLAGVGSAQGQLGLGQTGQGSQMLGGSAQAGMSALQNLLQSGGAQQWQNQQQLNTDRQNQMQSQYQMLNKLGLLGSTLGGFAGLQTHQEGTGTTPGQKANAFGPLLGAGMSMMGGMFGK